MIEKKIIKIYSQYLDVREMSEILNVHQNTIRQAIERGELYAIRLGNTKGLKVKIEDFDAFLIKKRYVSYIKHNEDNIQLSVQTA